jgi:hypothetical protein
MGRPVLGFVGRSSPTELRAILGVPGAAVFGDPLLVPSNSTTVRVAPGLAYAWIERTGEASAVLPLTATRAGVPDDVVDALPSADLAAFSPLGRSLALYSSRSGKFQVIGGLPDAPRIMQELDGATLSGTPDSLAVSDDGGSILAASGRSVYLLTQGSPARPVLNLSGAAALTFFPGSSDGAIADRGAGSVYLVRQASAGVLATGLDGVRDIASTISGQSLVLTNPGAIRIWTVNVTSAEVRSFDSRVGATGLNRIGDGDAFLISSEAGEPAWIFLPETGQTVFVPASTGSRPHRD